MLEKEKNAGKKQLINNCFILLMGLKFSSVYLFVVFLNFIFTNRYHFCHNKITQQIVFNNIKLRFIYSRQGIGRDFFWGVLEKKNRIYE